MATTLSHEEVQRRRVEGRDRYLQLREVHRADGVLSDADRQAEANFERYLRDLRAADFEYRRQPAAPVVQTPVLEPVKPPEDDTLDRLPASQPRDFYAESRAVYPWLPESIVRIYAGHFTQTRDTTVAWAQTRQSAEFKAFFDGIMRDDGTLRMSEIEYFQTKETYRKTLRMQNINPDVFESRFVELIKGEVSGREFGQRVEMVRERVLNNIGAVAEEFGDQFGLAGKSEAELIAAGLDPNVGLQILEGKITRAQISGEAKVRGFQRSAAQVDELARFGVTQESARQFYGTLQERLPALRQSGQRFNEGDFTVEDVEAASIFGDPAERQRLERLGARAQSASSRQAGVRRDRDGGLSGLERR